MTMSQFSPKAVLMTRLREIFQKHESGLFTILTDHNRSIMLRFSAGKLLSARCRSWDIANTIDALLEAEMVKFSFAASVVEDKPELMPAKDFMFHIDPDGLPLTNNSMGTGKRLIEPVFEAPSIPVAASAPEQKPASETEEDKRKLDRAVAARTNYF